MAADTNSSSPYYHNHLRPRRPSQPVADRILRALRQSLLLLHRSHSDFFILGATGNVYTVTLSHNPVCTCPDPTVPCKHILFVFIRVLGVSLDDSCLRRGTLRPCKVTRLLSTPTLPESLAGAALRAWFHELFFRRRASAATLGTEQVEVGEGVQCPVCLEEMEKGEKAAACITCRNVIHEECLARWRRSQRRVGPSCVICRASWRDRNDDDQDQYVNLAAYLGPGGVVGSVVGHAVEASGSARWRMG